jgi:outer membrane protein OmpA-like peptidoglycan-associated protein
MASLPTCARARPLLGVLLAVVAATTLSRPASAQAWPDDGRGRRTSATMADPDAVAGGPTRLGLGVRLGFGPAVTPVADDPADGPSLLNGTAFTGSALGIEGVFRYRFAPWGAFRSGLGFHRTQVEGFAESDTFRRELTLSFMTLGVPLLFEGGHDLGRVQLLGHIGLMPRYGVAARAAEVRSGDVGPEPALAIRTGLAFGFVTGATVGIDVGRFTLPLELRYWRNLTYPSTTRDRFDRYESAEDAGAYLVETRWTLLVSLGIDLPLGSEMPTAARGPSAQREPRQRSRGREAAVVVPPPLPPPPPPPAPAQPDQDGDTVPDRLDACPIEPANPADNRSYPGCPPSGGIVQLSCDRLYIGAPIDFESGSDVIQGSSYPVLYLLADTLELADNVRYVRIEGHTDDQGSDSANLRLSEDRAYAVMQFLTDLGIDPARLEAVGYGEAYPIADNSTAEGRAENRRVEFHIVENTTCSL